MERPKILIVEDNADLSDLLSVYLAAAGFDTSQAHNSRQITKALAERPDLIITDLHLPDMNTLEAIEILKKDPATSGIPIIVLSATSLGDWRNKALNAGVAEYLVKPTNLPDIEKVIRRLLTEL